MPFLGISAPANGPVLQEIYYRQLVVDPSLTLSVNRNYITLGVSGGSGTVTDINGLTGSVTFVNGTDTALTIGSNIAVNVLSETSAIGNSIVRRDADGHVYGAGPVLPGQLATKEYVDTVAESLKVYANVRVMQYASFGNLAGAAAPGVDVVFTGTGIGKTLTNNGAVSGFTQLTIDSVACNIGDRVLIAGDTIHNGVYVVSTAGSGAVNWVITRAGDFDEDIEVSPGAYVYIAEGTVYGGAGFTMVSPGPIIVDTTNMVWLQFNSASNLNASNVGVGGLGLFYQKNGNVLEFYNINAASSRVAIVDNRAVNREIDIDVNEAAMNLNSMLGPLFPLKGGTGLNTLAVGNFLVSNGLSAMDNSKVAPAGVVVGTTDVQTLTNKTLIGASNSISASMLRSSSSDIVINGNTPVAGNVLIATGSASATWQAPFSIDGVTSTSQTILGFSASSTLGLYGVAVGTNASSNGTFTIAIGNNANVNGAESIGIGRNATVNHNYSIALGNTSTTAAGQFKIAASIASINAQGVSTVGAGTVVCKNAAGDIGPNSTGTVVMPVLLADPAAVTGGLYYNSAVSKFKASNGSTWSELATSSKLSFPSIGLGFTVLRTFPDTANVAASWRYAISSPTGVGFRTGTVSATWNAVSNVVSYDEVSTADIGNTTSVILNVSNISDAIRFDAFVTSGTWNITVYEELF
jgi:hypothetical protein